MDRTPPVPEAVNRAVVALIVLYFALVVYAGTSGSAVASDAADALFGAIAVGIGAVLLSQTDGEFSPVMAAGICFVAGGIAQFGALATGALALELVTTFGVLVGITLYVYAVWIAD